MVPEITQYICPPSSKNCVITVGDKKFTIAPYVKIFVNGKTVKMNELSAHMKDFSQKEVELIKKQLSSIQTLGTGQTNVIESSDFEQCDRKKCKEEGIKYIFIGGDDYNAKFECIKNKFELYF